MTEAAQPHTRHGWFDPTFNLGHILMILTVISAIISLYMSQRADMAVLLARQGSIELAAVEMKRNIEKLTDNQQALGLTINKITTLIDIQLSRQKPP